MDPITQGVVGATAAQVVATRQERTLALALGWFSGMAADLDVLIRSGTDSLLALEYHRQFTHSLVFIPFGALICALVFQFLLVRKRISFGRTWLLCTAGYATHALLDACTTYGTMLLWPFSDARIAWNNVSVIDPLFTLPLLMLMLFAWLRSSRSGAVLAASYAIAYLSLGVWQNHRAMEVATDLAASRGHTPVQHGVKPSFANIIAWKSVYEHDGRYYVDAIRVLFDKQVYAGTSTEKLNLDKHFPWLNPDTQQARDVERFRWFSNQHLGIDPENSQRIIDIRYSMIPNRMDGMWGIVLSEQAGPDDYVVWNTSRPQGDEASAQVSKLWSMIKGD